MTILEQEMPLEEVEGHLSEVVDSVEHEHSRVIIVSHGKQTAVVISIEDLRSLEETLEILNDPELVNDIKESAKEQRPAQIFTKEEALALVRNRA